MSACRPAPLCPHGDPSHPLGFWQRHRGRDLRAEPFHEPTSARRLGQPAAPSQHRCRTGPRGVGLLQVGRRQRLRRRLLRVAGRPKTQNHHADGQGRPYVRGRLGVPLRRGVQRHGTQLLRLSDGHLLPCSRLELQCLPGQRRAGRWPRVDVVRVPPGPLLGGVHVPAMRPGALQGAARERDLYRLPAR